MEFKVGDKVQRKASNRDSTWKLYCEKDNLSCDGVYTIIQILPGNMLTLDKFTGNHGNDWDSKKFDLIEPTPVELISNNKENSVLENKKMEKKIIEVLAVNKKTGLIEKDIKVVASNEQEAILKAFGVDAENIQIKTTEKDKFEESKPQMVVLAEKESKK